MHDLWIFPTPRASRWFARMDWYLNWQMCKGLAYAGLHLPADTLRVAGQHGVPVTQDVPPGPLLIIPGARVPTKKCLVLDDREEALDGWLARAAEHARRLTAETARVFLPAGASVETAEATWTKLGRPLAFQFEVDPGTPA